MYSFERTMKDSRNFIEIKMDYYPRNLEEYLLEKNRNFSRLTIERKIILFQLLKGLNFIHFKQICHRDLSPHNVMVGDGLEVGITNLAYVKNSTSDYSSDNFYECNCYIRPPEVILQPLRAFESAGDIWSFGCLAVYLLRGELPFICASDSDMVLEIIKLLGVPPKEFLERIKFKDSKQFIFPKIYRKSMRQVFPIPLRPSAAKTPNCWTF
jgi:p38 MAP kinase